MTTRKGHRPDGQKNKKSDQKSIDKGGGEIDRAQKLAAALRANLKRRKAQDRLREAARKDEVKDPPEN